MCFGSSAHLNTHPPLPGGGLHQCRISADLWRFRFCAPCRMRCQHHCPKYRMCLLFGLWSVLKTPQHSSLSQLPKPRGIGFPLPLKPAPIFRLDGRHSPPRTVSGRAQKCAPRHRHRVFGRCARPGASCGATNKEPLHRCRILANTSLASGLLQCPVRPVEMQQNPCTKYALVT